ncbi:sporulation transcriptional regulator SpoIIID, partial [Mordavella massiliensis]|uniref:sporulation transcriptional regulator SpoIIID n=1 Tax=Mordavella massiliensis TaxID=1871024 RepID=UPI00370938D7
MKTGQKCRIQKTLKIITTAHKDVTERLIQINPSLAMQARKVLDMNKSERHI